MTASRRFWLRALALVVVVIPVAWLMGAGAVAVAGSRDDHPRSDAIIVLGAAQYVGHPSPVLQARLDHGADLWRDGVAPLLILTGGVGTGDTTSEAEVGRRYLRGRGIPDTAILVERTGRTTGQSLRAASAILAERKLTSAVLVSDPFHALRLRIIAHRLGMNVAISPTRTSPIERNARAQWRYVFNEAWKVPVAAFLPNQ
ncbi:MAG TPA: YdcF family protein [Gemmatimonadaceae bacterium]|nr:YdcF family protein [Gemmatimonadaceae bacterium]